MAGTFTHWMIVEEALERYRKSGRKHRYFSVILGNNHFVNLGAVGPDYPYLTDLKANMLKVHTWADRMHYENSGELIKAAVTGLLDRQEEEFEICLAWLCGFVSHVVADSIVHPTINAVVGPYLFNSTEHRHCEMTQDSYIFREIKGTELRYSEYVDIVKMCSDQEDEECIHPAIRTFWGQALMDSHPGGREKFDHILIDEWHENFLSVISFAQSPVPSSVTSARRSTSCTSGWRILIRKSGESSSRRYVSQAEVLAGSGKRSSKRPLLSWSRCGTGCSWTSNTETCLTSPRILKTGTWTPVWTRTRSTSGPEGRSG